MARIFLILTQLELNGFRDQVSPGRAGSSPVPGMFFSLRELGGLWPARKVGHSARGYCFIPQHTATEPYTSSHATTPSRSDRDTLSAYRVHRTLVPAP